MSSPLLIDRSMLNPMSEPPDHSQLVLLYSENALVPWVMGHHEGGHWYRPLFQDIGPNNYLGWLDIRLKGEPKRLHSTGVRRDE